MGGLSDLHMALIKSVQLQSKFTIGEKKYNVPVYYFLFFLQRVHETFRIYLGSTSLEINSSFPFTSLVFISLVLSPHLPLWVRLMI